MSSSIKGSAINEFSTIHPSKLLLIISTLFPTRVDFKNLIKSDHFRRFLSNNFETMLEFCLRYKFIVPLSNVRKYMTQKRQGIHLYKIIDNTKLNALVTDPFYKANNGKLHIIEVTDDNAVAVSNFLKEKCIERVILYGSVTHLPSDFCACNDTITEITYFMPFLATVGNGWMFGCDLLSKVNFKCSANLKNIGKSWMASCFNLSEVDFVGLENLEVVGSNWMNDCSKISELDFSPLTNLTRVDDFWISGCNNLRKLNCAGLKKLKYVGISWMSYCCIFVNKH